MLTSGASAPTIGRGEHDRSLSFMRPTVGATRLKSHDFSYECHIYNCIVTREKSNGSGPNRIGNWPALVQPLELVVPGCAAHYTLCVLSPTDHSLQNLQA